MLRSRLLQVLRDTARAPRAAALCLALAAGAWAQDTPRSLVLVDADTGVPVASVNFAYGPRQGVADSAGALQLRYVPGADLVLSHVAYGRITVGPADVAAALDAGRLRLQPQARSLQPVTVMAAHPHVGEHTLAPGARDRLEHDAGAFLSRTPALSVIRKSGSYGFDPVLRGFKYDQLTLLIDGGLTARPACPNRMDPVSSQVAMNTVEQVEVLKGPYSFRHGNAFAGTINFTTPAPIFARRNRPFGRVSSSYGSNGEQARTEAMLGWRGPTWDASLLGSWAQGNDYADGDDVETPAAFLRGSFGGRLGLKLSPTQDLLLSATRNLARDVDFAALPMDLRDDDTWMLSARHTSRPGGGVIRSWTSDAYASQVDHRMDNLLRPVTGRMVDAVTTAQTFSWGGRTEVILDRGARRVYAGADLAVESADGQRTRQFLMGPKAGSTVRDNVWQEAAIQRGGLFAEAHGNAGKTRWVASARLDVNHAEAGDADPGFAAHYTGMASTQVNPGLSLGVLRALGRSLSGSVWLGRAQRSGGLTERYINLFPVGLDPYEMLGNPDLDPEVNNQFDLRLAWSPQPATRLEVDLFASYLQDLISSRILPDVAPRLGTSPGVRQFVNVGEARVVGFEWRWDQALGWGLRHEVTGAYTRGQDLKRDEPLPEIPPLDVRYRLLGSYAAGRWQPEVSLRHVASQERVSADFGESTTPGFDVIDARLSWTAAPHWTVSAGADNLLDETYYEHLSRAVRAAEPRPIHSAGRSFVVVLTSRWR